MQGTKLSECGSAFHPLHWEGDPLVVHNKWMVSCNTCIPDITPREFVASLGRWNTKDFLELALHDESCELCGNHSFNHMINLTFSGSIMTDFSPNSSIHCQIYTFTMQQIHLYKDQITLPHCTIPRHNIKVPIRPMRWNRHIYRHLPRHIRKEIVTCYLLDHCRIKRPNNLGIIPSDVIHYMFSHLIMD